MPSKMAAADLKAAISQMSDPLKDLPFSLVIEELSGHKVIPFDKHDPKDKTLLRNLLRVADIAFHNVNKRGIIRSRPNEVGNDIEPYVKDALNSIGYKADTPHTSSGVHKSTGYPDIEFTDEYDRCNYLECKTFNIENIDTTQRSFYLSPSDDFKVTRDAHHFVISYEIYVAKKKGASNLFKCRSWKLLSLENLTLDVKYEFNSDNRRLYNKSAILAEG